jgi:hypothetical protein
MDSTNSFVEGGGGDDCFDEQIQVQTEHILAICLRKRASSTRMSLFSNILENEYMNDYAKVTKFNPSMVTRAMFIYHRINNGDMLTKEETTTFLNDFGYALLGKCTTFQTFPLRIWFYGVGVWKLSKNGTPPPIHRVMSEFIGYLKSFFTENEKGLVYEEYRRTSDAVYRKLEWVASSFIMTCKSNHPEFAFQNGIRATIRIMQICTNSKEFSTDAKKWGQIATAFSKIDWVDASSYDFSFLSLKFHDSPDNPKRMEEGLNRFFATWVVTHHVSNTSPPRKQSTPPNTLVSESKRIAIEMNA